MFRTMAIQLRNLFGRLIGVCIATDINTKIRRILSNQISKPHNFNQFLPVKSHFVPSKHNQICKQFIGSGNCEMKGVWPSNTHRIVPLSENWASVQMVLYLHTKSAWNCRGKEVIFIDLKCSIIGRWCTVVSTHSRYLFNIYNAHIHNSIAHANNTLFYSWYWRRVTWCHAMNIIQDWIIY